MHRRLLSFVAGILTAIAACSTGTAAEPPDFDRQIRPLLSNRCFHCHGPDPEHREAGLRLDVRESAIAELESGSRAIVPGNSSNSELLDRVRSRDDALRMPPPDSGQPLTAAEIALLQQWIDAGGNYTTHWAFIPPTRPREPQVQNPDWIRNPIDRFVLEQLEKRAWTPSQTAAPYMLVRRLSLDLTGLPPTREQVEEFVTDPSDEAYSRLVTQLLDSPHFGERMAMFWLDAARYSDTDGFQQDATRSNWPWRDWVIEAFNTNMPFDQFTREQFAGDLLTGATDRQRLATSFHRNHMTNGEGGRDPEESRIDYVIDRVNTTGTVWLGMTLGCCQCHSHKYDPIQQSEYYQLNAFFNSIDEDGRAGSGAKPFLDWTPEHAREVVQEAETWHAERSQHESTIRKAGEERFQTWLVRQLAELPNDYRAWQPATVKALTTRSGTRLELEEDGVIRATGPDPHHEDYRLDLLPVTRRVTGLKLTVLPDPAHTQGGLSRSETGHFVLSDLKLRLARAGDSQLQDVLIDTARADFEADPGKNGGYGKVVHSLDDDPRNGWATFGAQLNEPRVAVFALAEPLLIEPGDRLIVELQQRALRGRHNIGRFRLEFTDLSGSVPRSLESAAIETLAAISPREMDQVSAELRNGLLEQFLADEPEYQAAVAATRRAAAQLNEVRRAAGKQRVMVLEERSEPRTTHVLVRGVWDHKGDEVLADVPKALGIWPADAPRNRLGLAEWLTSADNPLTARVVVNHFWGQIMGTGLVRTPEDFGSQGERPTHPELLDWLAVEFRESGWNVKELVRLIVESATYRQTSELPALAQPGRSPADRRALLELDPDNSWLARANRFRLPGYMIRDQQLHISGLLNPRQGGPPVYPYQPDGVWADMTMGRFHYQPSQGPLRYRRTVYGFWRRTASPTFLFDSAQRRVCQVQVPRTNTPLHALTLLNDQTGLEAAIALAEQTLRNEGATESMLQELFERVLCRPPDPRELRILVGQFTEARQQFMNEPRSGQSLLEAAHIRLAPELPGNQLAALTVVASLLLNLDETITRQ